MNPRPSSGPVAPPPPRLLFEEFELRPDSGELLRGGAPVKLQPQPAKVLEILASRSGEVVSREEIRQLVWGDSFLDFDASLNFCVKQIRRALGDSATAPRYVETVPRRGYRFLRPVRIEAAPSPGVPSAAPLETRALRPAPKRWPRLASLAAVALAVLLLASLLGSRRLSWTPAKPRLAVLPLKCQSRDLADRQVCGGITETLTAELARQFPRDFEVIAPLSMLAYRTRSSWDIGQDLGASHILSGAADLSGRQLRVTARLARAGGGELLWEESFETDLGNAPLLYAQVTRRVAAEFGLPPPPAGPRQAGRPSAEAYEAYLRGMYLFRQREFDKAADSFQAAVDRDPQFAPAHAAFARALASKPLSGQGLADAEAAIRSALELDPQNPEAHLARGQILFLYHLDWERSGQEIQRTLALDPGNADAHQAYAMHLAALGRHEEALASVARARELDPASMLVNSDDAWFLYLAGRYGEAIRQARKTLELLPASQGTPPRTTRFGHFWSLWVLHHSAWKIGDEKAAVEAGREIVKLVEASPQAAGIRSLEDFVAWEASHLEKNPSVPLTPFFLAANAIKAGDHEQALDWLETDCRGPRSFLLHFVAVEPAFEPLRPEPRFARLVDCVKLPADAPARKALRGGA